MTDDTTPSGVCPTIGVGLRRGLARNAAMPVPEDFDRADLTRRPDGRALRPDRVGIFEGGP